MKNKKNKTDRLRRVLLRSEEIAERSGCNHYGVEHLASAMIEDVICRLRLAGLTGVSVDDLTPKGKSDAN